MLQTDGGARAFANFRVLNEEADAAERDHLIRNLAQLFSYVSDRCADEQVVQYDEVLCQLADIVEVEARVEVARMLAPLERAPGGVVVKLANDVIEVAQPLLEFSAVLSDDDLIEVAQTRSEDHRVAIAKRASLTERVSDAIIANGGEPSVTTLVRNPKAALSTFGIAKVTRLADENQAIAMDLRGRTDIDWAAIRRQLGAASGRTLSHKAGGDVPDAKTKGRVQAVVYNRLKNHAGFSADEWKLAWNQVKALADRRRFDASALHRFARFGYGHHAAAGLTMMLDVRPEVFLKWLAMQDYVAVTVSSRAIGMDPGLFQSVVAVLPWRDMPSRMDIENVRKRFEALGEEEARDIFELWRAHAFRRRDVLREA